MYQVAPDVQQSTLAREVGSNVNWRQGKTCDTGKD